MIRPIRLVTLIALLTIALPMMAAEPEPVERLEGIVVEAEAQPRAGTIVFLHGLGTNAADMRTMGERLDLKRVRKIYVNAPYELKSPDRRAWYKMPPDHGEGLELAHKRLAETLKQEGLHQAGEKLVLLGFSQGAVMSIYTGLRIDPLPDGIVAISGYQLGGEIPQAPESAAAFPRIWTGHGQSDQVVPLLAARRLAGELDNKGWNSDYHEYGHGHHVTPQEFEDIKRFLVELFELKQKVKSPAAPTQEASP